MILEGLVTTVNGAGGMHLAPMGPRMARDGATFVLRPFPTSQTFHHLRRTRQGVLHVTDNVLLLAQAAIGQSPAPACFPATHVHGFVLQDACRYMEFVVRELDETQERMHLQCAVVHQATLRDYFGLNRAKHAVVEAAIVATRLHLLPSTEVRADYQRYRVWVEKTGGPDEHAAFQMLTDYVERVLGGGAT